MGLQKRIEQLYATPVRAHERIEAVKVFHEFTFFLNTWEIRDEHTDAVITLEESLR